MIKYLAIATLLLFVGCAGWRTTANRSVLGMESLARSAEAFEVDTCGDPMLIVKQCKVERDKKCARLTKCETLAKALYTYRVGILAAKHALIQTEKTKETTQALVAAALKAYQPVASIIEVWK